MKTARAMAVIIALAFAPALGAAAARESGVPDGFVFVSGGDMIGPYHAWPGPEDAGFAKVAALFRDADLGFANQEGSIFDLQAFHGWPAAENGGGYPLQPPSAAVGMRAMGIEVVSKANNHATDWGTEGLVATLASLSAAGVAQAGAGLSLEAARGPVYVTTDKGVAALVDTTSTFPPMTAAGPAVTRRGVTSRPRPGISVLHVREARTVTAHDLASLARITGKAPDAAGEVRIGDTVFRAGLPGDAWEMSPTDAAAILDQVRVARSKARFVVFSIHAHETAGHDDAPPASAFQSMSLHRADEAPSPDDPRPAAFEPTLFHAAIDAGADVVARTGPHAIDGIEIYHDRPIFYGLGSLFFDFGGRRTQTSPGGETLNFPDAWFDTVIPVTTFKDGKVAEIRLYPMVIESASPATSGVPHPADPAAARRILEHLKAISAPFGTRVDIEGDVGIVRP
jgi:poly-gamma-glutamate synthesis protein (capsule biosynthesis protein)